MWEFELIAKRNLKPYCEKLAFAITDTIKSASAVMAVMADEENIYLSIGANEVFMPKIKASLRVALCDLICKDIKGEFISDNLSLAKVSDSQIEILKILCTFFDREVERSIVLQLLDLNASKLNLESFYNFKLLSLQKKWLELCVLINKSVELISQPQKYGELIKFLLGSIDHRCESAILELKDKCIIYHDVANNVDKFEPVNPEKYGALISKLVDLNPNFIVVKNVKGHNLLIKQLRTVFGCRLN